ncbi:unnamed protein product [Brugia timori]|uniref:AA_permease_C domain-containing protein n=1 Tax=Brugia timori TaxID=42155 RepID=A0A0R3QIS0_9BILA|nr:unnamed protein product [Brugia timori]
MPGYRWFNILKPGKLVLWCVFTMIFANAGISIIFTTTFVHTLLGWILIFTFGIIAASAFILICAHHQTNEQISFKVPLVPLIPATSVLINIFLMFHLAPVTWIRLAIWLVVGEFQMLIFLYNAMFDSKMVIFLCCCMLALQALMKMCQM